MSQIILNCFKNLNQNNLKNEEEGNANEEGTILLDETIAAKVEEEQAFQNFQPEEPNKLMRQNNLFRNVFSVCKQTLRSDNVAVRK